MSTSITGPITGGSQGRPFSLPLADLATRGYVAEEYFLDGTACGYVPASDAPFTPDGRWDAVVRNRAEFRTRVLVVRPSDPAAANGTAIVHWLNVTAGYELGTADDDALLSGFVWVGVSAQKVGIDGFPPERPRYKGRQLPLPPLKEWDAERYASLVHPGDAFSFDIFSQAGVVVRSGAVTGDVAVDRVVATGASQSGSRLTTYINAIHPLVSVYDAFLLTITGGMGTNLQDPHRTPRSSTPRAPRRARGLRDDIDEPVMMVNSEFEAPGIYPMRRADSERYRFWEVAGPAHTLPLVPHRSLAGTARRQPAVVPTGAVSGVGRDAPLAHRPNAAAHVPDDRVRR